MSSNLRGVVLGIVVMAVVVTASNILVRYPFNDFLTWGAFTYPIAFLITDLSNRFMGAAAARKVVIVGFLVAVGLSIWFATPRIALASGTAFLLSQLLDVSIFDKLRVGAWWRAPLVSSFIGSAVDTALFFSLAFAPFFSVLGPNEEWALGLVPLLGVGVEAPLWASLAVGDFGVKVALAILALVPFWITLGLVRSEKA